jgi:tripartite-type tricarboxylate transporter receptor subunit TctC
LFAPAGTPATIISRIHRETVRVLNQPDVKDKLFSAGVETVGTTPQQFAAKLKAEVIKWGKVIKDANIRAD